MKFWFGVLLGLPSGRTHIAQQMSDDDHAHYIEVDQNRYYLPATQLATDSGECVHEEQCASHTTTNSIERENSPQVLAVCGCLHKDEDSPHSDLELQPKMCCSNSTKTVEGGGNKCDCIPGGHMSAYGIIPLQDGDCCSNSAVELGDNTHDNNLRATHLTIWHAHHPFGHAPLGPTLKKCAAETCVHRGHAPASGQQCCGSATLVDGICGCISTNTTLQTSHETVHPTDCCSGEEDQAGKCQCIPDSDPFPTGAVPEDCCSQEKVTHSGEDGVELVYCKNSDCEPFATAHLREGQHCCSGVDGRDEHTYHAAHSEHFAEAPGHCPCIKSGHELFGDDAQSCCSKVADLINPSLCGYAYHECETEGGCDAAPVEYTPYEPEDYCYSHTGNNDKCHCALPGTSLNTTSATTQDVADEVASRYCCSKKATSTDHACSCIPVNAELLDHDLAGHINFEQHCCSRTGENNICTCAPVGSQVLGDDPNSQCCSGQAVNNVCVCLGNNVMPDNDQETSSVCCVTVDDSTACGCFEDGFLLPLYAPESACCSNSKQAIPSDLCGENLTDYKCVPITAAA